MATANQSQTPARRTAHGAWQSSRPPCPPRRARACRLAQVHAHQKRDDVGICLSSRALARLAQLRGELASQLAVTLGGVGPEGSLFAHGTAAPVPEPADAADAVAVAAKPKAPALAGHAHDTAHAAVTTPAATPPDATVTVELVGGPIHGPGDVL